MNPPVTGRAETPPLAQSLATRRIPGMDALRLLGVLLVMMSHAGLLDWSFGLQLLLVVSGFLITRMLLAEHDRTGTVHVTRFAWQRATRLMPAMLAYTALGAVYLWARGQPLPLGAIGSALAQVHNYYQALTGGQTHYLSHTWSLSLQEQFYVLWPLFLLWAWRRGMRLERAIAGYILGVWLVRAIECLLLSAPDPYLYRALETRSDNLAVGGLIAVCLRDPRWVAGYQRLRRLSPVILALSAVLLGVSELHRIDPVYRYVFGMALEPLLIALAMPFMVLLASTPSWPQRLLNARIVVAAGQGSYAMYLWQQILMSGGIHALTRHHWAQWPAFGVVAALIALLGHLSFTYFESPARRALVARTAHWFQQPPADTHRTSAA